jgi:hypothetical protein
MYGAIVVLVIFLVLFFTVYRAVDTCVDGTGGVLCKILHWLV